MKQDKVLQVCYEDQTVGTLAMTADHKVAFQYSDEWLETGFSINPFSLPLQKQVFVPVKDHFEGLFGDFCGQSSRSLGADYCWIACYGHINKIRMN